MHNTAYLLHLVPLIQSRNCDLGEGMAQFYSQYASEVWSFIGGLIGGGLGGSFLTLRFSRTSRASGESVVADQRSTKAGGDVVGRDKITDTRPR